jgi:hypothetical protein
LADTKRHTVELRAVAPSGVPGSSKANEGETRIERLRAHGAQQILAQFSFQI